MERARPSHQLQEKSLSLAGRLIKPAVVKGTEILMRRAERNILGPIKPEYPKGFDYACAELMKDSSVVPILISNHQGHADAAATGVISRDITEILNAGRTPQTAFRGFMLTIAASLETGHQNIFLQQIVRQAKKRMPKYSLSTQSYTRDKDKREYNMTSDREYSEKLTEIIRGDEKREADGLAFYVEGTVEGGRRIKEGENKGQIKGMQKIDLSGIQKLIRIMEIRYKKKAVLIPYGAYGAFNVLDPNHKNFPTLKALAAIANITVPRKGLLTARVGMPIEYSEIVCQIQEQKGGKATLDDIENHVGRMIADLLPEEAQGVYIAKA